MSRGTAPHKLTLDERRFFEELQLRWKPELFTQKTYARNIHKSGTHPLSPSATQWCFTGHCEVLMNTMHFPEGRPVRVGGILKYKLMELYPTISAKIGNVDIPMVVNDMPNGFELIEYAIHELLRVDGIFMNNTLPHAGSKGV